MFLSLEIKLALPVVLPLLERMRALAAEVEASHGPSGSTSDGDSFLERSRMQPEPGDLTTLLELFPPDFPNIGKIRVDTMEAPAVLRACALLRLQLRQSDLAALSDADLESGATLDYNRYTGDQQRAVMCYLFLATLQETLLKHRVPPSADSKWGRWLQRVQNYFRPLRADYVEPPKWTADTEVPPTDDSWSVIVHNDPVNLMSYVMAVFEITLGMRPEIAAQRMREVHEAKQSVVYKGSRQKAEGHAQVLRGWHLKAEAQSRK